MAAITHAVRTFTTTAGTKTGTATPALNDLIVITVACSSTTDMAAITVSDNNAGGAGVYTFIARYWDATRDLWIAFYVRTALIASATSTIFSAPIVGDTGGGLVVHRVSGMTRTGASAVRQQSGLSGAASTTPTGTMPGAVLTANPVIGAVINASNPAAMTPRGTPVYTESGDAGYATPATGIETMFINSGETGTAIAWGGTSASAYSCMVVELDTSAVATDTKVNVIVAGI